MFRQNPKELAPGISKYNIGARGEPNSFSDPIGDEVNEKTGEEFDLEDESIDWLRRAKDAYQFSTTFIDENLKSRWEDNINAFKNVHAADSKYHTQDFEKRSHIFRPKTRALIRKLEAACAAAYFSNSDIVAVEATNQSDKEQAKQAAIMKELLEYRLNKSIPWFGFVMGGMQDAAVTGLAAAHIHWITKKKGEKLTTDKPQLDLIPIENLRFDPDSNWLDPVNTSPYVIHIIPMYIGDVKERIASGEWLEVSDGALRSAIVSENSIKDIRSGSTTSAETTISDYSTVNVQRHIHRYQGQDYDFYTLDDRALLSDPEPLTKSVFHGERPYVIGRCIIETHNPFSSGIPELSRGIQEEANDIANQRLDNVKLVLNKRFIVKRNKQIDFRSLLRNVPGSVTQADDPEKDIRELSFQDVTGSSFAEQDRLNADMDELLGNFTGAINGSNGQMAETAKGMELLNGNASLLVEYTLRTYTETFVEPVLRQLAKLEQHYETDKTIIALCGKKAAKKDKTRSQFAQFDNTTEIETDTDITLTVNVGMGATSPAQRIQKLSTGLTTLSNVSKIQIPNLNLEEVTKEIFGILGFGDGGRFITQADNVDPQVAALQQQVQGLTKALQDKQFPETVKREIAHENNMTKLAIANHREKNSNARTLVDHYGRLAKEGLAGNAARGAEALTPKPEEPKTQPMTPPQPQPQQIPQPAQPQPQGPGAFIGQRMK